MDSFAETLPLLNATYPHVTKEGIFDLTMSYYRGILSIRIITAKISLPPGKVFIEMDLGADIPMIYRRRLVSELCGLFPRVELRTRKIDAGYTYTTWVELEKDVDAPPFETDTWIRLAFSS